MTASAQSYRVVLKIIEPTRTNNQTYRYLMLLCKSKADDRSKIGGMKRNNYNVNRILIKIYDNRISICNASNFGDSINIWCNLIGQNILQ